MLTSRTPALRSALTVGPESTQREHIPTTATGDERVHHPRARCRPSKKLTVFHKDPTKEQANEALIEKARSIGANAVVNIKYTSGIGFTTWGYIDAKGVGVKLVE